MGTLHFQLNFCNPQAALKIKSYLRKTKAFSYPPLPSLLFPQGTQVSSQQKGLLPQPPAPPSFRRALGPDLHVAHALRRWRGGPGHPWLPSWLSRALGPDLHVAHALRRWRGGPGRPWLPAGSAPPCSVGSVTSPALTPPVLRTGLRAPFLEQTPPPSGALVRLASPRRRLEGSQRRRCGELGGQLRCRGTRRQGPGLLVWGQGWRHGGPSPAPGGGGALVIPGLPGLAGLVGRALLHKAQRGRLLDMGPGLRGTLAGRPVASFVPSTPGPFPRPLGAGKV